MASPLVVLLPATHSFDFMLSPLPSGLTLLHHLDGGEVVGPVHAAEMLREKILAVELVMAHLAGYFRVGA